MPHNSKNELSSHDYLMKISWIFPYTSLEKPLYHYIFNSHTYLTCTPHAQNPHPSSPCCPSIFSLYSNGQKIGFFLWSAKPLTRGLIASIYPWVYSELLQDDLIPKPPKQLFNKEIE